MDALWSGRELNHAELLFFNIGHQNVALSDSGPEWDLQLHYELNYSGSTQLAEFHFSSLSDAVGKKYERICTNYHV